MRKRNALAGVTIGALMSSAMILSLPAADAQLFPYGASTTTVSMTTASATTTTSSILNAPSSSSPSPMPTVTPIATAPGFIQFNGLTVMTVSPVNSPADIVAKNPTSCESFPTVSSPVSSAMPIACPTFEDSSTFSIEVLGSARLLLADRSRATLDNVTASDTINAFGYYDGLGDLQASIVRDLSKPFGATPSTATPAIDTIEAEITQIQVAITQIVGEIDALIATSASTTPASSATSSAY